MEYLDSINRSYLDMSKSYIYDNKQSNINDIIYITAFFDIGRENWKNLSRNVDYYFSSFKLFLTNVKNKNIIAFIDDRYMDNEIIQNYLSNLNSNNNDINVKFIPINLEWLKFNCQSWQKNHFFTTIMNSDEYKNKLKNRINNGYGVPENIYPEYNTINHAKIDFINYSIINNLATNNQLICWIDFGYYNSILHNNLKEFPYAELDLNKFNLNKLNFYLRNKITIQDTNIEYTLNSAPEVFTGSFFAGNINVMKELHKLYGEVLDEFIENKISDDDQHVYLRCYLKNPNIFELFLSNKCWPQAINYCQKNFLNRFDFVNNYISGIENGIFAEIGVCNGSMSENILRNNNTCQLYCIDPYLSYDDYDDACKNEVGDKLYNSVKNKLESEFKDRVKLIREYSNKASEMLKNEFDFIYVDGNHKYKYVLEDITLWYEKLKIGGFLICDDACDINDDIRDENGDVFIRWNEHSYGKYGVMHACKNFAKKNKIPFFMWENQIILFKPFYVNNTAKNNNKIVAFLSNKLTLRGTEVAIYDYADYNEKILGNKSIIITRDYEKIKNEWDVDKMAYDKFNQRFSVFYYQSQDDIDKIVSNNSVTHIFIEKAGGWDGLFSNNCINIIHCVFDLSQPHGQVYTPLGETINRLTGTDYPVTPYMVTLPDCSENLRYELNIPENAIVFGRYGGKESFDIKFVHEVIKNIVNSRDDIYFLFMNTDLFYEHKNIIHLPGNADMIFKRKFINTCDALIHARERGETFGLTCGEFAICKKPVITWGGSREREHLLILNDKAVIYNTPDELENILVSFTKEKYDVSDNGYMFYNPENVMKIFEKVCLI
jgi:hypothetical protein